MSETMTAPVQPAGSSASSPAQGVIVEATHTTGEVREVLAEAAQPVRAEDATEKASVDSLLAFIEEHGIEEGFEYAARGFGEDASQVEKVAESKVEAVDKVENIEKVESGEQAGVQKETEVLKQKLAELTTEHEELRGKVEKLTADLGNTIEIARSTVLILHELIKKLYEEEEDKKKKESLFDLLLKLTLFLVSSLMTGPNEAAKAVKKMEEGHMSKAS